MSLEGPGLLYETWQQFGPLPLEADTWIAACFMQGQCCPWLIAQYYQASESRASCKNLVGVSSLVSRAACLLGYIQTTLAYRTCGCFHLASRRPTMYPPLMTESPRSVLLQTFLETARLRGVAATATGIVPNDSLGGFSLISLAVNEQDAEVTKLSALSDTVMGSL